jgi:hypothetical protein
VFARLVFPNKCKGRATNSGHKLRAAFDLCAQAAQPLLDLFIPAIDLADVLDRAGAIGGQRGDQQRHARANVGTSQQLSEQRRGTGHNGAIPKIEDRPWPGFPPDLMSIALVVATQAEGTVLMHEWMFDGRLFFVDRLHGFNIYMLYFIPY